MATENSRPESGDGASPRGDVAELRAAVEEAYEARDRLSPTDWEAVARHLEHGVDLLDRGEIRAASFDGERWTANEWVKKLILLVFVSKPNVVREAQGLPKSYDKCDLKFDDWTAADFERAQIRVVPGAVVRRGAFLGPSTVLMPCFVNIGAHVGAGTMIDTWATVGSCAQIGAGCHISGGAGIGGVLEPLNDSPVVIEDGVFVGGRCEIAEGVRVRRGAVISMGVFLGRSTPIVDRATGEISHGEIPEGAVVVPGSVTKRASTGVGTYAAVIVKHADDRTRKQLALNERLRGEPARSGAAPGDADTS
ncbi:MAG: 2,3,4,5-tetrahydropyridine-2,6-dicarboxylate N-succinyltransferase [Actinomycetota bacterium]|nr:2,3,4,5-tetrahydropyridine-2,6-dicarboxylate N-succinyltransferase [Actinomycetota bacterium]